MPPLAEIDIHLPGILLAYTALAVGITSPGPAVLGIIGTSLSRGRAPGVYLALGVVVGSAIWGTAAAAGMATVLTTYAGALSVIKFIGGCYLLWLAAKSMRSALQPDAAVPPPSGKAAATPLRMWGAGVLLHLTNPKAVMAWLATIALGVTASSPVWVSFAIVLGGILISLAGNLTYALVFSTKPMAAFYRRARRPIEGVFAAFFGFAGVKLLTSRT